MYSSSISFFNNKQWYFSSASTKIISDLSVSATVHPTTFISTLLFASDIFSMNLWKWSLLFPAATFNTTMCVQSPNRQVQLIQPVQQSVPSIASNFKVTLASITRSPELEALLRSVVSRQIRSKWSCYRINPSYSYYQANFWKSSSTTGGKFRILVSRFSSEGHAIDPLDSYQNAIDCSLFSRCLGNFWACSKTFIIHCPSKVGNSRHGTHSAKNDLSQLHGSEDKAWI